MSPILSITLIVKDDVRNDVGGARRFKNMISFHAAFSTGFISDTWLSRFSFSKFTVHSSYIRDIFICFIGDS